MGVERSEMATRPGRDHATECRKLHALREMPQRQAVGFQLILHGGNVNPALDARRPAGLVDFQNLVESGQVEADGAIESTADYRLHATAHGGTTAKGNHCRVGPYGVVKDSGDVGFGANGGDDGRRVAIISLELSGVVGIGLSVGVQEPVALGACSEGGKLSGNRQPRLVEFHSVFTRRPSDLGLSAKTLP